VISRLHARFYACCQLGIEGLSMFRLPGWMKSGDLGLRNKDNNKIGFFIRYYILLTLIMTAFIISFYSFYPNMLPLTWASYSFGAILIYVTSTIIGGFPGFLFAIPRAATLAGTKEEMAGYKANTNLEQVSDWLTKALLGIGLVEVGQIRSGLDSAAHTLAPLLGGDAIPAAVPLAIVLIASGLLIGFLFFYMATRTLMPLALTLADREEQNLRKAELAAGGAGQALVQPDAGRRPSEDVQNAARDIRSLKLTDLKTTAQKFGWARAQFWARDYIKAREGFLAVLAEQPDHHEARRDLGWTLVFLGRPDDAVLAIGDAVRIADEAGHANAVRDRIDQGWACLYLGNQVGFTRAIEILERVRRDVPDLMADPRLHTYLAAAYGQKYKATQEPSDRAAALAAVRTAIRNDDSSGRWHKLIEGMRNPPPGSDDDDLSAFRADPEFDSVLGPHASE